MSTTGYYGREPATHLDGSLIFATAEDRRSEVQTAVELGRAWNCELHRFGELAALDWYATRYQRMVGVVELKTRSHAIDAYPTVFLNVRKWLALSLASVGLGVPGIFVVRFTDALCWAPVGQAVGDIRVRGCRSIVKSHSDIEPVIEVDVNAMATIEVQQ